MNYKLIHDEEALKRFIEFLPGLKENETYFMTLLARRKWNPDADIPPAVKLVRDSVRKDTIIPTLRKWEVAEGIYTANGKPIPLQNLGVYFAYNPKDQHKACFNLVKECMDNIRDERKGINVRSMANDVIQTSNGSKNFMDIDVDLKEGETAEQVSDFIKTVLDPKILTFVRTSGGFHCLIRMSELNDDKGKWYQKIKGSGFRSDLNIMSHDLMPLVGCNQGKFVPYILG